MAEFREFWIVWSPSGNTPPRVRHVRKQDALDEAARLAGTAPRSRFYVLHAESMCMKNDVIWAESKPVSEMDVDGEEIPF